MRLSTATVARWARDRCPDDARLTLRLYAAADVLDLPLLDHLIVGDQQRHFSFHEAGLMGAATR